MGAQSLDGAGASSGTSAGALGSVLRGVRTVTGLPAIKALQQGTAPQTSAAPVAFDPSSYMTSYSGFGGYNGQSAENAYPQQYQYQPPQQPWQTGAPASAPSPQTNSYLGNPWFYGGPERMAQRARETAQQQYQPQMPYVAQATPTLQSIQQQQANQARGVETRFTAAPAPQYQEDANFYSWGGDRRFV